MKIRPVGAQMFYTDRHLRKLRVAYHNSVNAPTTTLSNFP